MSLARKLNAAQSPLLDLSEVAAGVAPTSDVVGVCDNMSAADILRAATDFKLQHICQKQGHEFEREARAAQLLLEDPSAFRRHPLSVILSPQACGAARERALTTLELPFTGSERKPELMAELAQKLESHHLSRSLTDNVVGVADEFFTNAVYNAPFVDLKMHVNPGVDRHTVVVQFDQGKAARLFLGLDANTLVIGCEDPFGSLDLQLYLRKILDTYVRGPSATMNFGNGGAGLGSYIIFDAGASLYFGVWPGTATVLACVIPLGMAQRKRVQLPKHLHWIQD